MTLTTDEDKVKAALFDYPEHIPVNVSFLPAAWIKYRRELDDLIARHPGIFGSDRPKGRDYDATSGRYSAGEYTDVWGCVSVNIAHGLHSIVKRFPVPTREAVHKLRAPEVVDGSMPYGFMYLRLGDPMAGFYQHLLDLDSLIAVFPGDDMGYRTGTLIAPDDLRAYCLPWHVRFAAMAHLASLPYFLHSGGNVDAIMRDLIMDVRIDGKHLFEDAIFPA